MAEWSHGSRESRARGWAAPATGGPGRTEDRDRDSESGPDPESSRRQGRARPGARPADLILVCQAAGPEDRERGSEATQGGGRDSAQARVTGAAGPQARGVSAAAAGPLADPYGSGPHSARSKSAGHVGGWSRRLGRIGGRYVGGAGGGGFGCGCGGDRLGDPGRRRAHHLRPPPLRAFSCA